MLAYTNGHAMPVLISAGSAQGEARYRKRGFISFPDAWGPTTPHAYFVIDNPGPFLVPRAYFPRE